MTMIGYLCYPRSWGHTSRITHSVLVLILMGSVTGQHLATGALMDMSSPGARYGDTVILCQEETFRPQCDDHQVVYVQQAQYGRMRMSRCLIKDFGYQGCSRNVLPLVEAQCSGRRTCSLKVLDETFSVDPCHIGLRSYLEIQFTCINVHSPATDCDSATLITDTSGYLSSLVTMDTGCGSTEAPWVVRAKLGQRLNITLYDFGTHISANESLTITKSSDGTTNLCKVYATIKEAKGTRRNTICGGDEPLRTAYVSLDSTVEIRIYGNRADKGHPYFFLHYQVIGCPNPEAPSGGWVKRSEDKALIGCQDNADTWSWTCTGTVWVGLQRNCTPAQLLTSSGDAAEGTIPLGLSIVIVVILALVVGATILIIGLVCLRRPARAATNSCGRKREPSSIPLHDISGDIINGDVTNEDKHQMVCAVRNTQTTTVIHRLKDDNQPEGSAENDYATTKLLTSSIHDPNGVEVDYGDYIRRAHACQDPYYMSRLECRHPEAEVGDETNNAQQGQGTSFHISAPEQSNYEHNKDAIIVDLGPNYDPEMVQIQGHPLKLEHSCACVHPCDAGRDGAMCADYIYHQGSCCRHCGGLVLEDSGSREQFHNACNMHTLGHLAHIKEGTDPNCVICSLPRNQTAKPSS